VFFPKKVVLSEDWTKQANKLSQIEKCICRNRRYFATGKLNQSIPIKMRSKIEDYNAVVEAATKFTKSVAEGNSKYAKELFTDDACLFGFLNGKFERGSIDQFYRNVDTVGAGDDFKTRIDVLELEETLAVVRVLEEGWGGSIDFTDVLLLLKIEGEWKCVAKAYNQNSNTIKI